MAGLPKALRDIADALANANTANSTANTAKTDASSALSTANTAKSTADAASTTANGAKTKTSRTDVTLTTQIAANTNYTVPSYVVGQQQLQVMMSGVLCNAGTAAGTNIVYKETGTAGAASTAIQFFDAIPVGTELSFIVTA